MEERRLYPRYGFTWPVTLHGPRDYRVEVEACEISLSGLGLMMDRSTVLGLAQGGTLLTPGDRLRANLPGVPSGGSGDAAGVTCRVVHVRRISYDRYVVALVFVAPDPAQKGAIAALVEQARETRLKG